MGQDQIKNHLEDEKKLRESKEIYKSIFENMSDIYYKTDLNGNLMIVSPSVKGVLGYSPDEVIGTSLSDLHVFPEKRKELMEVLREKGEARNFEAPLKHKDGTHVWLSSNTHFTYDQEGNVTGVEGIVRDITERKKAEERLRRSEERYRLISDNMVDEIWLMDMDMNVTFITPSVHRYRGFSLEDMQEMSWEDHLTPESLEVAIKALELALTPENLSQKDREVTGTQDLEFYCKDGSTVWSETTIKLLRNENGEPVGLLGAAHDITERKQAEEALRESEAQLEESNQLLSGVLEHTHMMAVFLDTQFNFIWVNRAYADTCKQVPSFFPGKNHFDLYPHEENQAIFQRVVDTAEPFFVAAKPFEFPDQPERGMTYWDWSLIPAKDGSGKVTGLVFTLAEVTERIRAEEALRESENRLNIIFESAPDAYYLNDFEGTFIDGNKAAEKLLGYSREELIGKNFADAGILPMDQVERAFNLLAKNINGEVTGPDEFTLNRKDGTKVDVEILTHPVKIGGEDLVLGIARDITERERMEAEQTRVKSLEDMINAMTDAVLVFDLEGVCTYANSEYAKLFGLKMEHFIGKSFMEMPGVDKQKPEEIERYLPLFESVFETGRAGPIDINIVTMDDREVPVSVTGGVIKDSEGNSTHIITVLRDVTKRVEMENELESHKENLEELVKDRSRELLQSQHEKETILNNMSELIVYRNLEMETIWASKSAAEWLGLTQEEMKDRVCFKARHDREEPCEDCDARNVIETGEPLILESDSSDGKYWHVKVDPVVDDDGNIIGTLETSLDITERKKAEKLQRVLLDITNSINTCENLDDLYPIIHRNLSQILDTNNFFIALYNKDHHTLSFPYYVDEQDEYEEVPAEKTNCHYIIRTGEALLADREVFADLNARGEIVTREDLSRPLIWLGAPLKRGDEVFGVVAVQSYTDPKAYDENDKEILQLVSHQIANAIDEVKAEEALRESEEQFRTFAETVPGVVIIYDIHPDGKRSLIYISPELDKLIGDTTAERVGDDVNAFFELIHPDDLDGLMRASERAEAAGESLHYEYRVRSVDTGEYVWVLSTGILAPLDDEVYRWQGQLYDITERKKSEILQSVLYSIYGATVEGITLEDLYRVIHLELNRVIDAVNFFIALYEAEKELLTFPYYVDENFQKGEDYNLLSRKPGKGLTEYLMNLGQGLLLTEDEIKDLEKKGQIEMIRKMPKNWLGVPLKVDERIIGIIAVQSYDRPDMYTDEDLGLLEFISSQIANTIERKRAEEYLVGSEEKFRKLFEDSRDAVFITRPDGEIIEMNDSGCMLFGCTREEIIGANAIDFYVNPDDREDYKEIIGEKGFVRNFEVRLRKKDGTIMDCLDASSIRIDGKGNLLGYQGVIHDITARKKAEQRLMEEFNRAEFYNDLMAHDINNFNQGVISNLELLLSSKDSTDNQRKYLENALGQVIGSADLISNLRKISRFRAEESELRSFDLTPLFQEAMDRVRTLFPKRKVEIRTNITKGEHLVKGNELLFDVFFNLLSNAVKFDRHNVVELEVEINEDSDKYWKIEIKDHGPGVEDNMKSMIFDRLTRANGSVHGSGLGLTVVKYIVDGYGGRIWVEDRIAGDNTKGSNFILQLPRGD